MRPLALSILICAATVGLSGGQEFVVKNSTLPDARLTSVLADFGLPEDVIVPQGRSIYDVALDRCGPNLRYLQILGAEQGGLDRVFAKLSDARKISFPLCLPPGSPDIQVAKPGDQFTTIAMDNGFRLQPRIDFHSVQTLSIPDAQKNNILQLESKYVSLRGQGESLASVDVSSDLARSLLESLPQYTPTSTFDWSAPQQSFESVTNNWMVRDANQLDVLGNLKIGTLLSVPASPAWHSIKFRPNLAPLQLQNVLHQMALQATAVSPSPDRPIFTDGIGDEQCGSGPLVALDADQIQAQLEMNESLLRRDTQGHPWPTILALDTGFPDNAPADELAAIFPVGNRAQIRAYGGTVSASSLAPGTPLVFKINAYSETNESSPPAAFSGHRWHGMAVTLAAIGGSTLAKMRRDGLLPVKVGVASILGRGADPEIEPIAILNALAKANRNTSSIDVINASFIFPKMPAAPSPMLAELGSNRLLVVAAGNDEAALNGDAFPAKMGGDPGNNTTNVVITVGMTDTTGAIHPESARSADFVDVLAPGCHVPTYAMDSNGKIKEERWNGTSLAAPIVSLTAALLRWYDLTPKEVKARIFYSVDFDPTLKEDAFSSGKLNMRNALAEPFDIVTTSFGTRYGQFQELKLTACGAELNMQQLARISVRDGRVFVWKLPNNPLTDKYPRFEDLCAVGSGIEAAGSFTEYGKPRETFSMTGVSDIIFAQKS